MAATTMTTVKVLQNNIYSVTLSMEYSDTDLELISDFSEPTIDVGGSFTGPPAFTLSTNIKKIKSQFPQAQQFDGATDSQAKDKANVWATEIQARMSTALTTIRLNVDDFTSEVIDTL